MDFSKPCTHCGICCKSEPCPIAVWTMGQTKGSCRALEKNGDIYLCGMMMEPSQYVDLGDKQEWKDRFLSQQIKSILGAGMGCCSSR